MPKMLIPSKLTELPKVQDTIVQAVQDKGFGKDEVFAIRLALDEAVSNAIHHGNKNNPAKKVTIEYKITGDTLTISISDEGSGFDPKSLPDPTSEENLTTPHGRGVMLIEAYMTDVHYNAKGNHLTMSKQKGCKLPAKG